MADQVVSAPMIFRGDHCRQDAFSLALQAVATRYGRPVDYETVYALSTNAFAPDIRPGDLCRCSWCKQGRGRALGIIAAYLGLKIETYVGHDERWTPPARRDSADAARWQAGYAREPRVRSLRVALARGETVLAELEWGAGALWCDWGFLTEVEDDGSIAGVTVDGPARLAEVRGEWHFISAGQPSMSRQEADLAMLRRAVERIHGQGAFAPGKDAAGREVLFGLAAVDAWADAMRQVPYSPDGRLETSLRQAPCTAWAASGGAEVAADTLRRIAGDLSPRAARALQTAARRYESIVELLRPALTGQNGESYEQFMGDAGKQRDHADRIIVKVGDRLRAAADQMEVAIRMAEVLPGQVRPAALEAWAAEPATDDEVAYLPAGVPAALLAALRQAGAHLSFDDLVAGTGWAFSFGYTYEDLMPAVLAMSLPYDADVPFEAFNWLPERLGFVLEAATTPDRDRIWAFVTEHVAADRLVLSEHFDGGLIYGYRGTGDLREVWFDGPVGLGWVPIGQVQGTVWVVQRVGSALPEAGLYRQALARALAKAERGRRGGAPQGLAALEAYRRDVADPSKDFRGSDAWFCWCAFERLSARLCCSRWLRNASGLLGGAARPHLLAASERYARAFALYDRYREAVASVGSSGRSLAETARAPERLAVAVPLLDGAIAEERAGIEEMRTAIAALSRP